MYALAAAASKGSGWPLSMRGIPPREMRRLSCEGPVENREHSQQRHLAREVKALDAVSRCRRAVGTWSNCTPEYPAAAAMRPQLGSRPAPRQKITRQRTVHFKRRSREAGSAQACTRADGTQTNTRGVWVRGGRGRVGGWEARRRLQP